ncbi:putative bifunctional diguanylate cyclase/phosphodiesterase [Geodermatophilus sp. URMC 64]
MAGPGRPALSGGPTPAWPRAAVAGPLAALAVVLAAQELLLPAWTPRTAPAALAVATAVVSLLVLRHCRRLDGLAATTWRGFAVIAGLLALGQLIRAVTAVGVNPTAAGPSDLVLAATGPASVLLCARLVRSTRGRIRAQVGLDAAVASAALAVALEMLIPLAVGAADRGGDAVLIVGYPAVSAVLCTVGLVTLGGVSAPRRVAAGWLLLAFADLAVAMASGALAVARPAPVLDVVTSTAYLAMLVAATLALAADPGPQAPNREPTAAVPLAGVVVSYCLSFAVVLFLLGGWALGRPPTTVELVTVAVLLLLTFVRTLVWARDGARLTRQVLRTEGFFRSLVHRAADITIVLDAAGAITWASGAAQTPTAWPARDLEGRPLTSFVHPDDRHELLRALGRTADLDDGPAPVFRLRTRDGGWRRLETVRTASSAGLPGRGGDSDGTVLHLRDVVERRSAELDLERMAYTDFLTGLANRARLMAALETARARASRRGEFCVLMLDLDGFKPVNDLAGHDAGDDLLVQVGARLRRTVRDRDLISRLGGDEFAVLVRAGLDEATVLAERIVAELRDLHPSAAADGLVLEVSGSVGVAEFDPADDVATTMRRADLALRAAKTAGKNCVRLHAADDAHGRRTRLARDLPRAIEDGQLRLVFQPVVGVAERRVLGLEALVRWQHPQLGTVPPDEFISLAEADGLIVPLERWVLGAATATLAPLLAEGRDLRLGVNVSVRHLQAGCLAPDVARALAGSGVPPHRLMLEITESVLMAAQDQMAGELSTLREMGCVLSLDDFGKGYSSLARLARLPVDILKMDREFVGNIDGDPRSAAIVGSVVELGRTLGMDVVAEGVETAGQLAALHRLGCRYLQGYLLGRPVPAEDLPAVLDGFDPGLLDEAADLTESVLAVH